MLIWLNGAFGAGKTVTAAELARLVPQSRLFDPEQVGYVLQAQLADQPAVDFQDWPAWRALVAANAAELAGQTGQHLVAPQTVLAQRYLDEIFARLRAARLPVFHVLLDAADVVLRQRIEESEEARQWRLDHLPAYQTARPWLIRAADLVLDTTALTAVQAAGQIAAALPGPVIGLGSAAPGNVPLAASAAPPRRVRQTYRNGVLVIVVDCSDLGRSARFWTQALGYAARPPTGPYQCLLPADGVGIEVLLQQVGDAKRQKNRLHLDLRTLDLDGEVRRLLELGATQRTAEAVVEDDWRWHVLADPDGNEFCVLRPPFGLGH
ncbi:MAG: VOC family protein [Streptosporangiaceae bacterium]